MSGARRQVMAGLLAGAGLVATTVVGCGGTPPPDSTPTPALTIRQGDRDQLAGLAAAAKDRRYVATYAWTTPRGSHRTVTVAVATDGSWVVAIPGGALSGVADVAIYHSAGGLFQCALGRAADAHSTRPDLGPVPAGCVKVRALGASDDPRVEHLFTDWIDPLLDRATALSAAAAPSLPGTTGACFSVESNSAALTPPVDPGTYCYTPDGILTGARVGFGTLVLAAPPAPAPPSVAPPAPVVVRAPLTVVAPAAPSPTVTASATPRR